MVTFSRLIGLALLMLVGFHYINQPVGLNLAGSIGLAILGLCLLSVYRGYSPDVRNWLGWGLIGGGCLALSGFSSFSVMLLVPAMLILMGHRLADLPVGIIRGGVGGDGSSGFIGGDSCGGDGGCGGD